MFKFCSYCEGCKKWKLFVKRSLIWFPAINDWVTSKKMLCGTCTKNVQRELNKNVK